MTSVIHSATAIIFLLLRLKISHGTLNDQLSECRRLERFGSVDDGDDDAANWQRTIERYKVVQVAQHEPAYLHCRIPQHSDSLVAWTRARDEALLTAGEQSFTSDPRFQVSMKSADNDWVLIIRRTEKADSGCYLCEVNTEPSSHIYPVYLNVIDNKAVLAVNMDGNAVLLNCTVTVTGDAGNDVAIEFVKWTRDGQELDVYNSRKYVTKVKRNSRTVIHTLTIREATTADGGLYACQADNTPSRSALVQIAGSASIAYNLWRTMRWTIVVIILIYHC